MTIECMSDEIFLFNKYGGCKLIYLETHKNTMFYNSIYDEFIDSHLNELVKFGLIDSAQKRKTRIEWMSYIIGFILGHRLEVCKRKNKKKTYSRFHFFNGGKKYYKLIEILFGNNSREYNRQGVMNITEWFELINTLSLFWPIDEKIASRKIIMEDFERDLMPAIFSVLKKKVGKEFTKDELNKLSYYMRHGFSLRTIDGDYLINNFTSKLKSKNRLKINKGVKETFVASKGCEPLDITAYDYNYKKYIMYAVGKLDSGDYRNLSIELGRMHEEEWEEIDQFVESDKTKCPPYHPTIEHFYEYAIMKKLGIDPNIPENLNIVERKLNQDTKGFTPEEKRKAFIEAGISNVVVDECVRKLRDEILLKYGEDKLRKLDILLYKNEDKKQNAA
ncbi:MAG: hypothetical protein ACOCUI_00145 [bacterium]